MSLVNFNQNYYLVTSISKITIFPITFRSPFFKFSLEVDRIVYTPSQGTNKANYFKNTLLEQTLPIQVGNKFSSIHFFPYGSYLSIDLQKKDGLNWSRIWKSTSKCFFRAGIKLTQKNIE